MSDPEQFLTRHGLMLAVLKFTELDDALRASIQKAEPSVSDKHCLLLFANAGREFWQSMQAAVNTNQPPATDNPVDDYSVFLMHQFADKFIDGDYQQLYPGNLPIPLISLGTHVGWSHPSPLGLTLHHKYGPWYAFRLLIKCDINSLLPDLHQYSVTTASRAPCLSCVEKPCVSHCPAGAVSASEAFDVMKCHTHRNSNGSACETNCPARRACPVGAEQAYDQAQLSHHMLRALNRTSR